MTDDEIDSLKLDGIFVIRQDPDDTHALRVSISAGCYFITTNHRPVFNKDLRRREMGCSKRMLEQLKLAIDSILAGYKEVVTETEYITNAIEQERFNATTTANFSGRELAIKLKLISDKPPVKIERRI